MKRPFHHVRLPLRRLIARRELAYSGTAAPAIDTSGEEI